MDDLKIGGWQPAAPKKFTNVDKQNPQGFDKVIKGAISNLNKVEEGSDKSVMDLLNGKADIQETMISLQKADISMRLFLAIRNKAMDAYREIMHMNF
ncbi:MAG: flagellar hook-basal body complex protein FliE [Desulfobacterales bacterium]